MFNIILVIVIGLIYLIVSSTNNKNKNTIFLRIVFLIFTVLVGFRNYQIGNDTQTYIKLFNMSSSMKWSVMDITRYEKGYLLFNILLSYLSNNTRVFLVVVSVIFNYSVYRFIKNNSNNYLLSVYMYVCLLFFYTSMTAHRQFFALSIILIAFKYIKERKFTKYLLFVMIASTFHLSSIVAIILYPLYKLKYTSKRERLYIFIGLIIFIFLDKIINQLTTTSLFNYTYEVRQEGYSLANSLYALTYLFMLIGCKTILKKNLNVDYNFELFVFLISFIINLVAIRMNIFDRVGLYFSFFSICYLPNIINQIKNTKSKKIIILFTIGLLALYSSTIIIFRPEWNSAFNYKF